MNILIDGQTFNTPEIHRGIGVYTKNVINNLLKLNYEHTWYIAIANPENLSELDKNVREKLHIIQDDAFLPGIDYARNKEYTKKIQDIIFEKDIDLFWNPNPLMVNVLFLEHALHCRTLVTVYDIIPCVFPDDSWPAAIKKEYQRRLDFLKNGNNLEYAFISDATKNDFVRHIGQISKANVAWLAADSKLFYRKRKKKEVSNEPYFLFTGGFDYRKNIDGAIEAFALARKKYSDDDLFQKFKLVIVGAYDTTVKEKYDKKMSQMGISDEVILTGYVSNEKLASLYQNAEIFFFPSKYEGFGLPILEAMLGGAYIISANNSSLPEVCGGYAKLCDADSVEDMADKLYDGFIAYCSETEQNIQERQAYALQFSWEKTGQTILDIMNEESDLEIVKEKLAIVTPWPNMKTGIANYIYKLVPYLRRYFEIEIFVEKERGLLNYDDPICIRPIKDYHADEFKHTMYEIGNNAEFHKGIFDLFLENPDVADIHDFILTPFFFVAYFQSGEKKIFKELLEHAYEEANRLFDETVTQGAHPNEQKYPMSEAVVNIAKTSIFHNHWSTNQMQNKKARVIPLACFDRDSISDDEFENVKKRLLQKIAYKNEVIIGCFGWVNDNKRPHVVMHALRALIADGYAVKLCFWGDCNANSIMSLISESGVENSVYIAGYMDKKEYEVALAITDIVVNLRYPSMGESSGTLCEAMKYGKAIIVSDLNQYKEFPDEVCWKLPIDSNEETILKIYLKYLIDNPSIREIMGENARNYADVVFSPEKIACLYYKYITGMDG